MQAIHVFEHVGKSTQGLECFILFASEERWKGGDAFLLEVAKFTSHRIYLRLVFTHSEHYSVGYVGSPARQILSNVEAKWRRASYR